jgi:transposase-like protein
MPQKLRLPLEEKIKIAESCINGTSNKHECSEQYGLSWGTVQNWIRLYESRGIDGLKPAVKARKYSTELKLQSVKEYLSGNGSLEYICKRYDISTQSMLRRWILRYNSHGDFKQPNSGGDIYMAKGRNTTLEERIEIVSYCIANNKDYGKTVEDYKVSYQQIYGWVKKYEKDGYSGLADRRGKRKDLASMSEVDKLRAQLKLREAENYRLRMENDVLKKLEELERGRSRN